MRTKKIITMTLATALLMTAQKPIATVSLKQARKMIQSRLEEIKYGK